MPLLNRIAVDAASVDLRHVRLDENDRYKEDIHDELNLLLTKEANIDQSARAFRQDIYASMLDEGYVAVCPVIADVNYDTFNVNKIKTARVGKIVTWYPKDIDVELYDDDTGEKQVIKLPKKFCVILQNPFYEIMNAPNSLMMRLRKKLAQLDKLDDKVASGKLDMIIQLPYSTRHETNRERAESRRHDLEVQLNNSRYGIGYIDASEKVIQLGKPLDNNLQAQIETLNKQLYDQIGIAPEILNNTANEEAQQSYINKIIEPVVSTAVDGMNRSWISDTAYTQGHRVMAFYDAFRVVPPSKVADLGDKLLRNRILTPNEMRGILGFKPSSQENADMLYNPNMPAEMQMDPTTGAPISTEETGSEEPTMDEELPEEVPVAEDT